MTAALKATLAHWPELSHAVFVPHTEVEYQRLVAMLDELVDEAGNDESYPLASLMEVIARFPPDSVPRFRRYPPTA